MRERWKPVAGFVGLYEVSNLGRVKSLKKPGNYKERILVPLRGEYLNVVLVDGTRRKVMRLHRLVAQHFLGAKPGQGHVHHKNGNKHDARAANLRWVTPRENQLDAYAKGLKTSLGENNSRAVLTEREVRLLRFLKAKHPDLSSTVVASFYGLHPQTILEMWRMRRWKHV